MELEFIVGKWLSAQVVFVSHFYWFNIPPVKRMFYRMASQVSEGISRIARDLQIAAGKTLSFICCCVPHRQFAALRGCSCRLLPVIMSQVLTFMWMQGFLFTKMFLFSSSQVSAAAFCFYTCGGRRLCSRSLGLQNYHLCFHLSFSLPHNHGRFRSPVHFF